MALLSFFSPYDPTLLWNVVPRDLKPSAEYLLGTDSNGQDIFWQATFAVRNSLIISLIAAIGFEGDRHPGRHDRRILREAQPTGC